VNDKTISEGLAAEKLNILSDKKRAKLRLDLEALLSEAEDIRHQLKTDEANRLKHQWFIRGWTARNP